MLCYIELLKKYLEVILNWYINIASLEILLSPLEDLILHSNTNSDFDAKKGLSSCSAKQDVEFLQMILVPNP